SPSSVPLPSVPGTAAPAAPAGTGAALAPPTGAAAPTAPAEPVRVATDLFDVEIDPMGGDIRRLTLRKVFSAEDRTRPLTLMEPDPQHYFVTQSGLLGDGLPNHKTVYEAGQSSYALADGKDTLEVRLHAKDGSGVDVTKR